MDPATSILIAFLSSEADARQALGQVQRALASDAVALVAIGLVTLEGADDRLHLRVEPQPPDMGGQGREALDRLFPPQIRAMGAVGVQADAAADYYATIGIGTNLLKELGENLPPRGAALLVIVTERWVNEMDRLLTPAGALRFPLLVRPAEPLLSGETR